MAAFFIALPALANFGYALRSFSVALRSGEGLDAHEGPNGARPSLSIIVPARNEERQIETCVRSLLAQGYDDFEVIVVDDRSEDSTRAILARIAEEDSRLRIVDGSPLPDGWVGKPWALVQGTAVARGEWLLFTDADTEHEPQASAAAYDHAHSRDYDALSLLTDQVLVTPGEWMCLPTILWTIGFAVGPIDDINDPKKPDVALFNGQYILISRKAYDALGGHAAVKGKIAEDFEFARHFKHDGRFRGALVSANGLVRTRMYRSFGELWNGFVKNFALGARGNTALALLGISFLAFVSPLAPSALVWALATRAYGAAMILAVSMAAAISGTEVGMRRMRFPRWSGLWMPFGTTILIAISLTSLVRLRFGGVTWRGRRYRSGESR